MIKSRPLSERPRERCLRVGADGLSLRECLAIILGTGPKGSGCLGLAAAFLERFATPTGSAAPGPVGEDAFFRGFDHINADFFARMRGFGPAASAKILATLEVARRYAMHRQRQKTSGRHYADLEDLAGSALRYIGEDWRAKAFEWLGFVPVFAHHQIGSLAIVEKGVRQHVNTDPQAFFAAVLAQRPVGIFLVHNHPSGDVTPSAADDQLTRRVAFLCEHLQIRFLGHWIVSFGAELLLH